MKSVSLALHLPRVKIVPQKSGASLLLLVLLVAIAWEALASPVHSEQFDSWQVIHEERDRTWYAVTPSERHQGIYFGVVFTADADCDPVALYAVPAASAPKRQPDGDYQQSIKLRVDTRDTWVVEKGQALLVTSLSIDKLRAVATIYFWVGLDFVSELTYGEKVRLLAVETDQTDRFDLRGAKVAIAVAKLRCTETLMLLERQPAEPKSTPSVPRPDERFELRQTRNYKNHVTIS